MIHEINYPNPPVWYIAYTPKEAPETGYLYTSHGYIASDQCFACGMEFLETFINETAYLARLIELGIPDDTNVIDSNL